MKLFDLVIEVLLAIFLYVLAPLAFDSAICIGYMLLYAYQLYRLFRLQKTDKGWLSFNTLFFVMLTLVTYLMPILYLMDLNSQILTVISYDERYVSKSLFLTSIAVTCYKMGYFKGENKSGKESTLLSVKSINRILRINKIFILIALITFLGSYSVALASGKRDISGLVVTLINCIFIFSIILSGYSNKVFRLSLMAFLVHHRFLYLCTFFIVVSMLVMGDRYTPICLAVTTLFIINRFVHRFTSIEFVCLLSVGFMVLVGVSLTRDTTDKKDALNQERDFVVYFQDIIPINLDFYLGLEWKEKNGYFKPARFFQIATYPIPFLPTIITDGIFDGNVSSGVQLTEYNRIQTNTNDESGIGTHAIVDIYMSWGIMGIIILFYLFGFFVGTSSKKSNSLYYLFIYGCFVSRAIYIPRETLFTPYRDIVYLLIFASIIIHKKRMKNEKQRISDQTI